MNSIVKQAEAGARAVSGEHVRCGMPDWTFESAEPRPHGLHSRETTSFAAMPSRFVHVAHFKYSYLTQQLISPV